MSSMKSSAWLKCRCLLHLPPLSRTCIAAATATSAANMIDLFRIWLPTVLLLVAHLGQFTVFVAAHIHQHLGQHDTISSRPGAGREHHHIR